MNDKELKNERQEAIRKIITENEISTQEELSAKLYEAGYRCTQATISRDTREMHLTKVQGKDKKLRYAMPKGIDLQALSDRGFNLGSMIIRSEYSFNIVVVQTRPGLAMALATGVDSLHLPDVLGCVPGDDTVLIVTRGPEVSDRLCRTFHQASKNDNV